MSPPREKITPGAGGEARLSRYIRPEAILDLVVKSKGELLRALAEVVVENASSAVVEKIYQGILEREAAVNTYVGSGVAIPHARVDCIDGITVAMARNPAGFPYGIDTGEPVVIAVLVVGHEELQSEHMQLLGLIATQLQDRNLRDQILKAPDPQTVLRLLDVRREKLKRKKKARPLTQLLLTHARRIATEMGATATIVTMESADELAILKRLSRRTGFIVATSSRPLAEKAQRMVEQVLLLPKVPVRRDARIRLVALMALTHSLVRKGDVVAFLSGEEGEGLDSMTILEMGRAFGRFVAPSGVVMPGVEPGVLERVLTLATELGAEGREGAPVGTVFVVVGNPDRLAPYCQQMVMNPFRGYPEEERNVLDPTLAETIKEFAAIDGAFVVRGDGVVLSAGTYLKVDQAVELPGGYGARHHAACAVTKAVDCTAVALSQSTGEVTVFRGGGAALSLPRSRA